MDMTSVITIVLTIIGVIIGGLAAFFQYRQYIEQKNQAKQLQAAPTAPKLAAPLLIDENNLGEVFRRYFASILKRPFYPLKDQLAILERAKIGLNSQKSYVVVLAGSGGIGKTTIAGEIVRQSHTMGFLKPLGDSAKLKIYEDGQTKLLEEPAILRWDDLINTVLIQLGSPSLITHSLRDREDWVRRQLRLEKYLVLIDNLETTENTRDIVIKMRDVLEGSNSRAIITYRFNDLGDLRGVISIGVVSLSEEDSRRFIEKELESRGYSNLHQWLQEKGDDDAGLNRVIALSRGTPLVLQLVIGLRNILPLASVLSLLTGIRDKRIEDLYEYLYRQELKILSKQSLELLTSAFSKQEGYFREELVQRTGLSFESLMPILVELSNLSLIYTVKKERPSIGDEDFFYIHPMFYQLLNKGDF